MRVEELELRLLLFGCILSLDGTDGSVMPAGCEGRAEKGSSEEEEIR